jgi:nicotinic acid phosphoribosyltransferase
VETLLLNQVTLHTTLATKAARYRLAAPGKDLVDFAFRRTHGVEAAMAAARGSAIVGFAATSNVEAARRYGLTVAGTMAHSFIEAFPSESEAFRAFAEDHPDRTTFLVDTYDTLNGVKNAIAVVKEMQLTGRIAVRLDSGDVDALSRGARALLDGSGLTEARIFASGGLDELEVEALVRTGAPVDAFGIGTQMGVSADAPFVDSVYKLTDLDGHPVLKLSAGKETSPGPKQVWRGPDGDTLALRDEAGRRNRGAVGAGDAGWGAHDLGTVDRRHAGAIRRRPRSAPGHGPRLGTRLIAVRTSAALEELTERAERSDGPGRASPLAVVVFRLLMSSGLTPRHPSAEPMTPDREVASSGTLRPVRGGQRGAAPGAPPERDARARPC